MSGMLILLPVLVCFAFLAVGGFVFVVSLADRRMRQFTLSAALWCAMWGPCLVVWMLFAGMLGVAAAAGADQLVKGPLHTGDWLRGFGIGLGSLAFLSTAAVASGVAWVHQALIRRMTFALFRIYATLVSAGIGSVWAWSLALWMAMAGMPYRLPMLLAAMLLLVPGFGYLGFRLARQLRGKAPERFTWVTPEEFDGSAISAKPLGN